MTNIILHRLKVDIRRFEKVRCNRYVYLYIV